MDTTAVTSNLSALVDQAVEAVGADAVASLLEQAISMSARARLSTSLVVEFEALAEAFDGALDPEDYPAGVGPVVAPGIERDLVLAGAETRAAYPADAQGAWEYLASL